MAVKNRGLGRGLSALLENKDSPGPESRGSTLYVDLEKISPNPYQPRKNFNEQKLDELSASIKTNGLIQPIVVRPVENGYEIITGERRWRACSRAGLSRLPVIVREMEDHTAMALAMIENLQREDLNPMEKAAGMDRLRTEAGLGQEGIARELGISRAQVANTLRLLKLPTQVQNMVAEQKLSSGHARTLLGLTEHGQMIQAARKIIQKNLNVRQTEKMVQEWDKGQKKQTTDKELKKNILGKIENGVGEKIKINFSGTKEKGRITLKYTNEDELNKLLDLLGSKSHE